MGVVTKHCKDFTFINISAFEDECCICGKWIVGPTKGIAMWCGMPVPLDYSGEWAGFSACDGCYEKHQRGELEVMQDSQGNWF